MKFLCDEMLAGLARWLRAAGHDAAMAATGDADRTVLQRALDEGRRLLTRDRALLQIKDAARSTILLHGENLNAWAYELAHEHDLNWLERPLSRCLVCNVELIDADADTLSRMPEDSRTLPGPFKACPKCGRGYWPGSHAKRMMARLHDFAAKCGHAPTKRP
ncbi:DUF5615 family PIN-like protein [Magnetovibrio sp.]|uniref:DUF5615 family PIN-like protein n=1 Tax=Magnetovibrio sp. TaxID=2024836 RepID=UPI002F92C333